MRTDAGLANVVRLIPKNGPGVQGLGQVLIKIGFSSSIGKCQQTQWDITMGIHQTVIEFLAKDILPSGQC